MSTVRGLYHGQYELQFRAVSAPVAKRAFIIPGQGAAYPGMFRDFLHANEEFRSVFRYADEVCGGYDLLAISHYIQSPQLLTQAKAHVYRNCALYASEVAMGRTLLKKGVRPDAITGHSFGECAGLVLAGIISYEEMFHIVVHRNLLCPPANELGFMVTLNGTREKLADFLHLPGVYLANLNSPKQLVVSIAAEVKEATLDWLRTNRVPHIILQGLPQPYHSPLMEPYRKKLHDRIASLTFTVRSPEVPFFSSIVHRWITKENVAETDFTDLLARQLTEPVNFIQQIEALHDFGCTRFYEVGPGKMLEPPMKTILGEKMVVYRNVEALLPKDADQKLLAKPQNEALKKSRWFGRIKDVLHTVTGYKTDDIDIAHSFQNDLGIDSIKKAEILVKIIKDENLNASSDFSVTRFSTIYEAVEYLENYSVDEDPLKATHDRQVELVVPEWRPSGLLRIRSLESDRIPVLRIQWHEQFLSQIKVNGPVIVVLECASALAEDFPMRFLSQYQRYLSSDDSRTVHVTLLDRTKNEAFFPLATFLRSLVKERRPFSVSWIHDPESCVDDEIIRAEYAFSTIRDVRYLGGVRSVRNFVSFSPAIPVTRKPVRILAFGGSRGINFEILRRFPVTAGDELILVGRTPADNSAVASQIKALSRHWKEFRYVVADLEDPAETLKVLGKVIRGEVDVLINAAGKEVSKAFEERDEGDVRSEINSKVLPQRTIEEVRKKFTVRRVINFSSIVSLFGNKGQSVYAWSNALLEMNQSPGTTALAWGPWEDVGMTTNLGILQKIREWGISLIAPEVGARLAAQVMLAEKELPSVIIPMDRKDVFLLSAEQHRAPLLGKLTDAFEGVFDNEVRLDDHPYLEGHSIIGNKILPVAWFLSQLLIYGRSIYSRMVTIEDFEVHNLLFLENDRFFYKLQIFPRSPCDVNIWSVMKNASGRIVPDTALERKVLPFREGEQKLDPATFYESDTMGQSFQFLRHAWISAERVRVESKLSEVPQLSGNGTFDFWLFLIDLAFQSISLQVKATSGAVSMPTRIGRMKFSSESVVIGSAVFFYPEIHEENDREGRATVILTNERNEVFCRLENVVVRKHFLKNALPLKVLTG